MSYIHVAAVISCGRMHDERKKKLEPPNNASAETRIEQMQGQTWKLHKDLGKTAYELVHHGSPFKHSEQN